MAGLTPIQLVTLASFLSFSGHKLGLHKAIGQNVSFLQARHTHALLDRAQYRLTILVFFSLSVHEPERTANHIADMEELEMMRKRRVLGPSLHHDFDLRVVIVILRSLVFVVVSE